MKKMTEAEVYKLLVRIGVSAGYTGIDYIIRAVFAINAGKVDNPAKSTILSPKKIT